MIKIQLYKLTYNHFDLLRNKFLKTVVLFEEQRKLSRRKKNEWRLDSAALEMLLKPKYLGPTKFLIPSEKIFSNTNGEKIFIFFNKIIPYLSLIGNKPSLVRNPSSRIHESPR